MDDEYKRYIIYIVILLGFLITILSALGIYLIKNMYLYHEFIYVTAIGIVAGILIILLGIVLLIIIND